MMTNLVNDITTRGTFSDSAITYTLLCKDIPSMTDKTVFVGRINRMTTAQTQTDLIYMNDVIADELETVNLGDMTNGTVANNTVNTFTLTATGGTMTALSNPVYAGYNLYSNPNFQNFDNPGLYINGVPDLRASMYPEDCTLFPIRANLFVTDSANTHYNIQMRILTKSGGVFTAGSVGTIDSVSGMTLGFTMQTSFSYIPDLMDEIWIDLQESGVTKQSIQIGKSAEGCPKCFIQFVNEVGGISTVPFYGRLKKGDEYKRYTLADIRERKRDYLIEDTLEFTANTGWLQENWGNSLVRQIVSSKSIILHDMQTLKSWSVICGDNNFTEKYYDEEKRVVNYAITFTSNKAYRK